MGQRLVMPNADFAAVGIDNNKRLTRLEVTKQPTNTTYPLGSGISLAGAEFRATFSDGTVSNFGAASCRYWPVILEQPYQIVTVAYTYSGITATTYLTYTAEV